MQLSRTESLTSLTESKKESVEAKINQESIQGLRQKIDLLDEELAIILIKRFSLSQQVQVLKRAQGDSSFSPKREQEILQRLHTLFPLIPMTTIDKIYCEIFNWMRPKD